MPTSKQSLHNPYVDNDGFRQSLNQGTIERVLNLHNNNQTDCLSILSDTLYNDADDDANLIDLTAQEIDYLCRKHCE